MATLFKNGQVPKTALVQRGVFWLTAGTWAKVDAMVADIEASHGVTLHITSSKGNPGSGAYRDLDMQDDMKAKHGPGAAARGTSSHGGTFKGRDAMAVDISNYWAVPLSVLFAAARRAGLVAGYFDGNGKPYEPWHFIDYDPYRKVPATAGASTPTPARVPEKAEDDMTRNVLYKTTNKGKYPIRAAVTNDTSGLWVEFVDNEAGTMNLLAQRYDTGDAITVSNSMFDAARNAAAQVRPQTSLAVSVGEPGE